MRNIEIAAEIINKGGLVAFPTETVYGLGANALNPIAVAKIFEMKERPTFDPLIVHIASFDDLGLLSDTTNYRVMLLAKKFWPGPLTIVLPKSSIVPDIVTSGLSTVGIRMPDNEIALNLIRISKCPIAAPSANKFGKLSPVSANHVRKYFPNLDCILDGGNTSFGIESTIVCITGNECQILRPGVITIADIENALPGVFIFNKKEPHKLISPGLMNSHYSPLKPSYVFDKLKMNFPEFSGIIRHGKNDLIKKEQKIIYTSHTYNHLEIASNLFSALHSLEDDQSVEQIFIEALPEVGLGVAIMDRVKKATYKYQTIL